MNETVFDVPNILFVLGTMALQQCGVVLGYPFNPEQRIFVVWLFIPFKMTPLTEMSQSRYCAA